MHVVNVTYKDGAKVSGILWTWRPHLGYFDLGGLSDEECDIVEAHGAAPDTGRVFLKDIVSAVEGKVMTHANLVEDVELLDRAKEEGWKP